VTGPDPARKETETTMTNITTANDLRTWIDNANPLGVFGTGLEQQAFEALRDADHPRYGEDWGEWLETDAIRILRDAIG
jgi:hypothetical protein